MPDETRKPGEADAFEQRVEEDSGETPVDRAIAEGIDSSEEALDARPVQGWNKTVSKAQETMDATAGEHTDSQGHLSDTVHLLGREFTITGGIYTVVFIALGVLTVIEVLFGSVEASWVIPILLSIAVAKALLVILFYMHLRTDSRIFALTLAMPLLIVILSITYLMAVPPTY